MRMQAFAIPLLLPEASARSNRALAAGLAVSLAVHLLVVMSVRPVSGTVAQPGPLRVMIVRESEETGPRAAPEPAAQPSARAAQAAAPRGPAPCRSRSHSACRWIATTARAKWTRAPNR
jgi:hypothetical protein